MTTEQAEIASPTASAEVDSEARATGTDGSAPSGDETTAAKTVAGEAGGSPEKKRDEVNERFDKLTRDLYELRGERDRDRYEIQTREQRIKDLEAQLSETAKQRQVAPDTTPTLEQFGYDETKYQAALYSHLTKTVGATLRDEILGEIKQTESQRKHQEAFSTWQKREDDFIKLQPDYVDKVRNNRSLPISQDLAQELLQMDDGPQIAYYLAENQQKAAVIAKLPLAAQMRELGRIQAQLDAKKAAPPVSKAPPPVAKVDATEAPSNFKVDTPDSDNLSDAEWTRRRNAQEQARMRKFRNG